MCNIVKKPGRRPGYFSDYVISYVYVGNYYEVRYFVFVSVKFYMCAHINIITVKG